MMPQELQTLPDEVEASRASRRRAWENLQEIRWVLKEVCEIELPPPAKKTIDLEGRLVKDGVRKGVLTAGDVLDVGGSSYGGGAVPIPWRSPGRRDIGVSFRNGRRAANETIWERCWSASMKMANSNLLAESEPGLLRNS
jgi:hypothetical protein